MKRVLISGAAGGLGTAVVQAFLQANYHVTALVQPQVDGQAESLRAHAPQAESLQIEALDVLDAAACADFIAAQAAFDVVIPLVGGFDMGNLADTAPEAIDSMYQLNFRSAYNLSQPAYKKMDAGRFIFIGAKPAFDATAGANLMAYALSKKLVIEYANLLNAQADTPQIQATVIVPSIIDTPANRSAMPDANFDDWVRPEQLADVMVWACSDTAAPLRESILKVYGNS